MPGIEYSFSEDGAYILLKVPRCLLVFTRAQWVEAIRRGKSWKRRTREREREEKYLRETLLR
jgi:hypothetical protein